MTINYVGVLACGAAAMAVGFAWYGPLFGKTWMRVMGTEAMTPEQKEAMKKSMWGTYLLQFILSLITAGVLDYHIMNWADFTTPAVAVAICIWFGFVMTTVAGAALWSGKPAKTASTMFLVSAGGHLVTFAVFGFILGMWQ